MATKAKVAAFDDRDRANRTVRWLRRSGLHARVEGMGRSFVVVVPSGREEQEARRVLDAVKRTRERTELAEPTGWDRVRDRLLNVESLGTVIFVVSGAVLLLIVAVAVWAFAGLTGWLALIVILVAGLVYFAAAGVQVHSAVKSPRRYSRRTSITMDAEQEVEYRLAWARSQYRKARSWPFRRRRRQD